MFYSKNILINGLCVRPIAPFFANSFQAWIFHIFSGMLRKVGRFNELDIGMKFIEEVDIDQLFTFKLTKEVNKTEPAELRWQFYF